MDTYTYIKMKLLLFFDFKNCDEPSSKSLQMLENDMLG